jgi:hypothetical protein
VLPELLPLAFRNQFLEYVAEQVFVDPRNFALLNILRQRLDVLQRFLIARELLEQITIPESRLIVDFLVNLLESPTNVFIVEVELRDTDERIEFVPVAWFNVFWRLLPDNFVGQNLVR